MLNIPSDSERKVLKDMFTDVNDAPFQNAIESGSYYDIVRHLSADAIDIMVYVELPDFLVSALFAFGYANLHKLL